MLFKNLDWIEIHSFINLGQQSYFLLLLLLFSLFDSHSHLNMFSHFQIWVDLRFFFFIFLLSSSSLSTSHFSLQLFLFFRFSFFFLFSLLFFYNSFACFIYISDFIRVQRNCGIWELYKYKKKKYKLNETKLIIHLDLTFFFNYFLD